MDIKLSHSVYLLVHILLLSCVHVFSYDDEYQFDLSGNDGLSRKERAAIKGEHLNIIVQKMEPYTMKSKMLEQFGKNKYYGYIPDLLEKLSQRMGFNYTLVEQPDGKINVQTFATSANDMIAAPVTITKDRARDVDFIHPFAHVGLTVVIQDPHIRAQNEKDERHDKNDKKGTDDKSPHFWEYRFNIFEPFSPKTWGVASLMIVIVWLFMWITNRYNPYEYGWRYDNGTSTEDESKLFNAAGAFWFVASTLQWQGYDRRPRSWANRTIACFFMCFVLLTLVSYIASSVNHMFWADAVRRHYHSKNTLKDLVDLIEHKDGYEYGVIEKGATYDYLTTAARGPGFKKMKEYFADKGQKQLVKGLDEGFDRARNKRYAFIVEDVIAKYWLTQQPCDLVETGITFGMSSYGFALKKDSPHREAFNKATLALIEEGFLERLDNQWFAPNAMCKKVQNDMQKKRDWHLQNPGRVDMHTFWSPTVFIVVGLVVSCIVAGIEVAWYRSRGRYRSRYEEHGTWQPEVES